MAKKKFKIYILPQKFAICHFEFKTPLPKWALEGEWFSVTKTDQEISIVFPEDKIPGGVLAEKGWRAFRIEGLIEGIYVPGIIATFSKLLADKKISIFNISTYQTNYIFVEERNLKKAIEILGKICEIKK